MKPRRYIAGPIAGIPDFPNRFAAAVPTVEAMGYEAVDPCNITPVVHEGECPPGYDPGEGTSTPWHQLVNPRPLTPAEYAEHRIPMPCTHTTQDEETA